MNTIEKSEQSSAIQTSAPAAFSATERSDLYADFAPLIRKLINQYGTCPQLREELTGEIYCRFSALIDAYDPSRGIPIKPYLVRQLTASVYTFVRAYRRSAERELSVENHLDEIHQSHRDDPTHDWLNSLEMESTSSEIAKAVCSLSERQKRVVMWRYLDNYSFEQIAQSLQVESATARSLLRHGLNSIRKNLQNVQSETK